MTASRRRIRVALFVGSLGGGGAQRHVSLLAPRLDRDRFGVVVACRTRRGEYLAEVERSGIEVVEFRSSGKLFGPSSIAAACRLARFLDARHIDVLHSFLFECNIQGLLAGALSRQTRIVAGLRNMDDKYPSSKMAIYVESLRLTHRIVAVCEPVRTRFVDRGVPPSMIDVVENGIEVDYAPRPEATEEARRSLGFETRSGPLVLTLASLHKRKGLEFLLRAAALVRRTHPTVTFVVFGEGPERKALESLRDDLGLRQTFHFPGTTTAVREVLRMSDVFALSSLEEGISNALLEAQAEGVPAVVTAVGGNAVVVRDGITGLVVPPASAEALAGGIDAILSNSAVRSRMSAAARDRITREFGLDRMVRRMESVYDSVLEDRT